MSTFPVSVAEDEGNLAAPDPYAGLTLKQRRFVDAYLGEARGNATDAARLAGYDGTDASLRSIGSENLRKPSIAACVRAAAWAVMGEYELIERLAAMIRKDAFEYAQEYRNKHGVVIEVRLDMNAWVKAIELMMKYLGMLVEKHDHSGTLEHQQQIKQMTVYLHAAPPAPTDP